MQRALSSSAGWRVRPLLRSEFDKLVLEGVFQDQRVQLLEGELIEMSPQGTRHAETIRHLNRIFARALSDRYALGVQTPMAASDISEPEPDRAAGKYASVRRYKGTDPLSPLKLPQLKFRAEELFPPRPRH